LAAIDPLAKAAQDLVNVTFWLVIGTFFLGVSTVAVVILSFRAERRAGAELSEIRAERQDARIAAFPRLSVEAQGRMPFRVTLRYIGGAGPAMAVEVWVADTDTPQGYIAAWLVWGTEITSSSERS
jgi:hypothetical protein